MLSQRVAKARSIVKAGLCHQVNSRAWQVPGSDGKRYLVTRRKGETIFRCDLDCGGNGLTPCKGNGSGVCYHTFATIIAGAESKGRKTSFCSSKKDAQRLANMLHGQVWPIQSAQGRNGKVWVVVS